MERKIITGYFVSSNYFSTPVGAEPQKDGPESKDDDDEAHAGSKAKNDGPVGTEAKGVGTAGPEAKNDGSVGSEPKDNGSVGPEPKDNRAESQEDG